MNEIILLSPNTTEDWALPPGWAAIRVSQMSSIAKATSDAPSLRIVVLEASASEATRIAQEFRATVGAGSYLIFCGTGSNLAPDLFDDVCAGPADPALPFRLEKARRVLDSRNRQPAEALKFELLDGILDGIPSGVILLGPDGRVRFINRRGAVILGMNPADLQGHALVEILPEVSAFSGDMLRGKFTLRTREGALTLGFSSAPLNAGDSPDAGRIIIFQDITELDRLRTDLRHKERAAILGDYVASIAHELRNPLFGISAVSEVLQAEFNDTPQAELVGAIFKETERMGRLLEDMLSLGNPALPNLQPGDPVRVCLETVQMLIPLIKDRGISHHTDIRYTPPANRQVRFDADKLRQVFYNLLQNAIQAAPGGTIRIVCDGNANRVLFTVEDDGVGMGGESLPYIFDPYYSKTRGGSGLGLAITKRILEDHGGGLAVETATEKGLIFRFWLPCEIQGID